MSTSTVVEPDSRVADQPPTMGQAGPVLTLVAGHAMAHLHVRPARPSDLPLLEAMVDRSSPDTIYRRFHGVLGSAARRELRRICRPTPDHRSWVAVGQGGVRGTVTLAFAADGTAEIAVFVEDDWFRHGVGRALAQTAVAEAGRLGIREIVAYIQPENFRAREFFRSIAPGATSTFADREIVVRIPVAVSAGASERPPSRDDEARRAG